MARSPRRVTNMADQIRNMGNFGKSEKGEASPRGQGAQAEAEQAQAEAEAAKQKGKKKGADE